MKLYRKGTAIFRVMIRRITNPLLPILSAYERNRKIIFFCLFCWGVGIVEINHIEWNYAENKMFVLPEWIFLSSMCGAMSVIGTICAIILIAIGTGRLFRAAKWLLNFSRGKFDSIRQEIRQEEIIIAEKEEKGLALKDGALSLPSENNGTLELAAENNGTLSLIKREGA